MNPLATVRDWLLAVTRVLPMLGFGRRAEPPLAAPPSTLEVEPPAEVEPRPERHTEIPPDQLPGGGAPHR